MKIKQTSLFVLWLFACTTTIAQTASSIIERVIRKDPSLLIFVREAQDKFVVAAAVDERTHVSYMISCFGQLIDSSYVSAGDYNLLLSRQATPFQHYTATGDEGLRSSGWQQHDSGKKELSIQPGNTPPGSAAV